MQTILKKIKHVLTTALLVILLSPVVYFAWRVSQPMTLSEFKGLTYYQVLTWERQEFLRLADRYQASYPEKDVRRNMCWNTEFFMGVPGNSLFALQYTMADIIPGLRATVSARDQEYIPEGVTWHNFLEKWWLTYERIAWWNLTVLDSRMVPYCRLHIENLPTPAELEASRLETVVR